MLENVVLNEYDYQPCWLTDGYIVWPIYDPFTAARYRRKVYLPPTGWRVLDSQPTNFEKCNTGCLKLK